MNIRKSLLALAIGTLVAGGVAGSASAETAWQQNHPRREEVNNRLVNLDRRIHQERRDGELTFGQARYLRHEDRAIRGQERFAARFDRGHITRAEQRALNQEENGLSRQVGR
ncbi:MAG TPA: hypothetical protein VNU97_06475 [Rhizomicrobium sp.]|jgi:hypothetical protein|nr:hypothetical protein [Rhizomicrobium sp.]